MVFTLVHVHVHVALAASVMGLLHSSVIQGISVGGSMLASKYFQGLG